MGKIFIPMYTTGTPYNSYARPPVQRGCDRYYTKPTCQQTAPCHRQPVSILDVLLHGILGQLQTRPVVEKQQRAPWVRIVNLKGFQPEEISVKVEEHVVHLTAKSVEESEAGHDVVERYRKIQLPDDVDVDKLNCFFGENGKLFLKAPYVEKCPPCGEGKSRGSKDECCKPSTSTQQDTETGEKLSRDDPGETNVIEEHQDLGKPVEIEKKKMENEMKPSDLEGQINHPTNDADDKIKTEGTSQVSSNEKLTESEYPVVCLDEPESDETHQVNRREKVGEHATIDNVNKLDSEGPSQTNTNAEIHGESETNRPNSPQESLEFVILDQEDEDTKPHSEKPVEPTENILHITELENEDSESSFPLMIDTTRVTEIDGERLFEINVNLQPFKPEDTSINWTNGSLQVRAVKDVETDSITTQQKVQREFTIPKQCDIDAAHASMDDDGRLHVTIPLKNKQ